MSGTIGAESMWALLNSTNYAAERFFARDRGGAENWVVVVKGTFNVRADGSTIRATEQEPIHHSPQFVGDPSRSSLRYDADLLPPRPFTDVVVHGHAHAPPGPPCSQVDVSVRVGPIARRLRVWGDRTWRRGLTGLALSEPAPFERVPLVYERAFGGFDPGGAADAFEPRNPAGVGFATSSALLVNTPAPNIEDPAHLIRAPGDRPPPAGFGPIPTHWQPRCRRAGTHDREWERERMPLVPRDFEDRHYQCAPDEQQVPGHLSGGEPVELRNLTPGGLLRFALPRVSLDFSTRIARQPRHHEAHLQAVIIEPDVPRVMMVWATAVACHHTLYSLEGTWIRELGAPRSPARPRPLVRLRLPAKGPR